MTNIHSTHTPGITRRKRRTMTVEEALATPYTFIVEELLPPREFVTIEGAPTSGKSLLVLSLAIHVASGVPWFGHAVEQGPVIYLAGKKTKLLIESLYAITQHHCLLNSPPIWILEGAINFGEPDAVANLATVMQGCAGPSIKLLVIETMAMDTRGLDEGCRTDMAIVVEECAILTDQFGCTVLLVQHGDGGRSHLRDEAMASFHVTRHTNDTSDVVTFTNETQRQSKPAAPMYFDLVSVHDEYGSALVPRQGRIPCAADLSGHGTGHRRADATIPRSTGN